MMNDRVAYELLAVDDGEGMERYLSKRGWLHSGERIEDVTRAGEGNMNCTLRVRTDRRSFIAKQSRPWVEKYPSIAAPEERVLTEAMFYRAVAPLAEVAARMPRLLDCDERNRVVLLEDLGETADFTFAYRDGGGDLAPLHSLCRWLSALHGAPFDENTRSGLENRPMRELNHEHIFCLPLRADSGLDLDAITPGLAQRAHLLIEHAELAEVVAELGQRYLSDGNCLLHGDFYPGSWVQSADGVWIIDPEFCFFGPGEFDVGVLIAHLLLAGRSSQYALGVFDHYDAPVSFSRDVALRFAGVEIMRRLIGVAQLPLDADLAGKERLLTLAQRLILAPCDVE